MSPGPRFRAFLERVSPETHFVVLCHSDADGLAAGAIFTRTLERFGRSVTATVTGKGEGAWTPAVRGQVAASNPGALIVTDLGSRPEPVVPGVPMLLVDHHRPLGVAPNAELITGYGERPTPTSGLLAYWCCEAVADIGDLKWVAALSILSDLGDKAEFTLLDEVRRQFRPALLREATTLLNGARRSSSGNARPALDLLLRARTPEDIVNSHSPEADYLRACKAEVNAAFTEAKKAAPQFSGPVAIIRMHTPCQVHPLVAQIWRTRLRKYIVMAVNTGFRPGYVHFSARCGPETNLIDFLHANAPADTDEGYGHGHDQASGGALTYAAWNEFVQKLGFGPEMLVVEKRVA